MPGELLIGLLIGVVIVVWTVIVAVRGGRLAAPVRVLTMVVFVVAACFSALGFASSFEPGDFHVVWRVLFGCVFVSCLVGTGRLLLAKK